MPITGTILTLDLAAQTGFAVGAPGSVPIFGTHNFTSTGDNFGRHQANARRWLRDLIFEHNPVMIGYEQPSLFSKTTPATVRKLSAYCNVLEEECLREGFDIPVREINPSTLKLFFTGNGKAKKDQMVQAAHRYGFKVQNDDEADAVAMWLLMVDHYGTADQKARFHAMRFEAGFGVAQSVKF